MNTNTSSVGSATAMPTSKQYATSKVGVNLNQLLDFAMGKADTSSLKTDEDRALYNELAPKYDAKQVTVTIEEQVLFRTLEPHLIELRHKIPDPIPIISRHGSIIASEGNISAVVGAAKSKKTFLCTALVGALLRKVDGEILGITPKNTKVLWVDTEQSANHVQRVVKRIYSLAGWNEEVSYENLRTLSLREIEPKERYSLMVDAIKLFKPKLVVIDGISDLMYNSNCIEESDAIVGQIMTLSTEYNCHIMSILHTNPNSDKARGHIGSTLQRKVETMIYVHKIEECSIAEPQFCRNEEFAPFAFHINEEGLPEECDMPSLTTQEVDTCVMVMRNHFPNGIERKIFTNKLVEEYNMNISTARVKICRAIKRGLLQCEDNILTLPKREEVFEFI